MPYNSTNRFKGTVLMSLGLLAAPRGDAAEARDLDCVIEPYRTVNVSSPVPGVLHEVLVERGDPVAKGQAMAKLQSGVEEASVNLAQVRAEMTSEILASQARLGLSSRALVRTSGLFQKKLLPWSEQDEAETKKIVAEYELKRAREDNHLAQMELKRAIETLKLRTLEATVDGVVVERFKMPGEYVEDQPVVKIAQIDPLNVEVVAPLALLGSVGIGMEARVRPEQPVGGEYRAKVTIVDQVVDAASGTFGIRLSLPNPDHRIPAGLRCGVEFLPDSHTAASMGFPKPGREETGTRSADLAAKP